ncbi:DUF2142 domain-containing protein [uncultured Clostridium sp.]|uniref:DUF2142 domain-containing protein n=1 Tax=uncultured Clostridium sp. TaxID=59620 RepID=UPI0025DFAFB6|nr:DUF2142 domain-containing protein [uncultured Clostridium sp.]
MKSIKIDKSKYLKSIKERYVYILIITAIMFFFSYFLKENIIIELSSQENLREEIVLDGEINEHIKISRNNLKQLYLNVENNKEAKPAEYEINVLQDDNVISSKIINTEELGTNENIGFDLSKSKLKKNDTIVLQIKTNNLNKEDGLKVSVSKSYSTYLDINGVKTNETLPIKIVYGRFTTFYICIFILIYLAACSFVILWDNKKIYNCVFAVIIGAGVISAFLNPVMDIPDEPAHLSRAELTSRGILVVSGDVSKYSISQSLHSINENTFCLIEDSQFISSDGNYDYSKSYNNYASTNIFIGYIPQAIGIILGKLIGGSAAILFLGRLCNLLAYALMARYAIKISPRYKVPLSVVAMMPMAIFIAASFNQDATTYGLALILIAYFLKIYDEANIGIKEIAIFSIIAILVGLVKLPYSILGGLLIFIPKDRFKSNKIYYKSFLFVFAIAAVALMWGVTYMLFGQIGDNDIKTPVSIYFEQNNVSSKDQIKYIISSPKKFSREFLKYIFNSFRGNVDQLNTFGWLAYTASPTVMMFYQIFLAITTILFPEKKSLSKKTRIGVGLIIFGVYVAVNLMLYITWTTVGSPTVAGVQGRYFCSLFALLPLVFKRRNQIESDERNDFKFVCISILFLIIYMITLMNRYY